jgi:hypothetical protein
VVAFLMTLMNIMLGRFVEELTVQGRRASCEEVCLELVGLPVRRHERGMRCHD